MRIPQRFKKEIPDENIPLSLNVYQPPFCFYTMGETFGVDSFCDQVKKEQIAACVLVVL